MWISPKFKLYLIKKFDLVFNELQRDESFKQKIFFEGQIYDSYSLIIDIIKSAKKKIVIIDNYVDDSVLKMLVKKNKGIEAVILTSEKSNISKLDIQKFNKEYPILKVAKSSKFHDRFIVIDNKELYHCGASIKDLGKKCFGINKQGDFDNTYLKARGIKHEGLIYCLDRLINEDKLNIEYEIVKVNFNNPQEQKQIVIDNVRNGNMAVIHIAPNEKSEGTFSKNGHYIAISDVDTDNNFYVINPNKIGDEQIGVPYTYETLINNIYGRKESFNFLFIKKKY